MQHSFDIEQQQRWSTNNCHHRKLLLTNSTKATLENTCAENKACSSIQNPITLLFSTADPRRGKHANVLLVPFIILLYYVCFHSQLSEDYWFPSLCQRRGLEIVVYATIGLIFTILVSTIRLLTMSNNDFIMDHKRPILSFFTLHKLFYIPLLWLAVLTYGQLEISLTECHHGPAAAHFYILATIIWFPASTTL
mgnify:CR=1 FL=1